MLRSSNTTVNSTIYNARTAFDQDFIKENIYRVLVELCNHYHAKIPRIFEVEIRTKAIRSNRHYAAIPPRS